jgi:hypothetical protein
LAKVEIRKGPFTQEDPLGLAGGLNVYGFANGDPVTYSDPFGLKVDLSGLDADERAKINALRKTSKTFERWYSAIDRIPADKLLLRVSTAKDGWVGMIQGAGDGKTFKSGQYANIILSSSANWASLERFRVGSRGSRRGSTRRRKLVLDQLAVEVPDAVPLFA